LTIYFKAENITRRPTAEVCSGGDIKRGNTPTTAIEVVGVKPLPGSYLFVTSAHAFGVDAAQSSGLHMAGFQCTDWQLKTVPSGSI